MADFSPDAWNPRRGRDRARDFWLRHRDYSARKLADMYPERKWRTWQDRISTARHEFPELWARVCDEVPPETPPVIDPVADYGVTVETFADGRRASDRLLEITEEQSKDNEFMLRAHGFDPHEWEIVSARSNIWQGLTRGDEGGNGIATLYQSKIIAKPIVAGLSIDKLVEAVCAAITPVKVPRPKTGKRMLELSFTDMHFGNSTLDHYRGTIARTLEHIRSRKWRRILIWVGSDFFHTDNFKNTTSNGTPQSSMWWPDAWRDGLSFIGTIIEAALESGVEVVVVYVPGNHDESMTWGFVKTLMERYPQAKFDDAIAERKVHVFGHCAVGMTHGDEKVRKDLDRVFVAEFAEFASATFKEVHMGHLHHESVKDNFGTLSRSMPTAARTDKWHRTEGFVGARKVFQLFEWDADCGVTDVHYV